MSQTNIFIQNNAAHKLNRFSTNSSDIKHKLENKQ